MKKRIMNLALLAVFCLASTAQDGLTAHFDMTLGSGMTITESVSARTFAVNHVLAPENVDGAVGKALRLDGYSTYVEAALPAGSPETAALTVSLWCAPETYPMMNAAEDEDAATWIAGNLDDAAKEGFAVTLTPHGEYGFKCYAGGQPIELTATDRLPRYEWSHLVAVVDAVQKTAVLYRNGLQVASDRCPSPVSLSPGRFLIGKSPENRFLGPFLLNTFNGLIDDITLYDRALTQAEASRPEAAHAADLSIPARRFAADLLRPAFHGMPAAGWTNECHGMAWSGGRFHVFFQKNANGPYMGRLHWGHIYSDNLYKWHEDKIAIAPGESYDVKGCWSGVVFTDSVLTGGRPAAVYTGADNVKASLCMAFPEDDGLTVWRKSAANPIVGRRPEGLSDDFRDPYFFTAHGRKYLIAGSSRNGVGLTTLHEWDPATGRWSNDGRTFFCGSSASACGTFWEMPNITAIGGKWLFTTTPLNTAVGVETLYWTGDITADGQFVPTSSTVDRPLKIELDGFSRDGYGLLSPTIFNHDGTTILMGIVPDKLPFEENYKLGWAHCYSLPREISVAADGTLVQKPYGGLTAMRTRTEYSKAEFTLQGTETLAPVGGRKYELCGEFVAGRADFGFHLFKGGGKEARLSYSPVSNRLTVDVSGIDRLVNDDRAFNGVYSSELPRAVRPGETLKLHVFFDHSILDVFVNDTWAFSLRVFPTDPSADGVEVFADAATKIKRLEAWNLDENNPSVNP